MTSPQPNDMIFQHSLRSHLKPKKLAIAVTIGISLLAVTHSSYAFKPNSTKLPDDAGKSIDNPELALTHANMTRNILAKEYQVGHPSGGLWWEAKEVEDIVKYNECVDLGAFKFGCAGELSDPAAHCDAEHISECGRRVFRLRAEAYSALEQKDWKTAREKLGRALHTIQDFYSHSNYSDMYLYATTPDSEKKLKMTY